MCIYLVRRMEWVRYYIDCECDKGMIHNEENILKSLSFITDSEIEYTGYR